MKRLFSLVKGCCEIFLKTFLALRTIEPNRLFSLAFGNFMIRYDISPLDPEAHLFIVGITIDDPTPDEQYLRLPTWIAGSYLIRDFASTIQAEQAFLGETPVPIEKVDKSTWRVSTVGRQADEELFVYYQVWAFDSSVRGCYLDNCRGFFNPGAALMEVLGNTDEHLVVNLTPPVDELHHAVESWKVGTGLKRAATTEPFGWGLYEANRYEQLCDCPIELSDFSVVSFKSKGTQHHILINEVPVNFDEKKLADDVKKITETVIGFFEPKKGKCPAGDEYTFLLNVTSSAAGGLEHANSTALAAPRKWLPCTHDKNRTDHYVQLLTLFAHEYFHTWLVKRIKPAAFIGADFSEEAYTSLLWLFEGFTSYYENLLVRRAGLIDDEALAKLLSKDLKAVIETPAHLAQSLSQSSFDAWIKFYKPNANTVNAHVSYYRQGALAAWVLDAEIRRKTKSKKSLDDVLRLLWEDFKAAGEYYSGITADDVPEIVSRATELDLTGLIADLTQTAMPVDYAKFLKPLGVVLEASEIPVERKLLGIGGSGSDAGFTVRQVYDKETAQWIGIAPGDVIIALDGVRVKGNNLSELLARYGEGDEILIHAFRDDALLAWAVLLGKPKTFQSKVVIKPTKLGKDWLS